MHHSIELTDVYASLGNFPVLQGVNVEAKPCEFISVVGANGAGKSTLLKVVNGTLKPYAGKAFVLGFDLFHLNGSGASLRRDIGLIPQTSHRSHFPVRVEEAVLMGRYGKIGLMQRPKQLDRHKAEEAMKIAGISRLSKKLMDELSGGEQQKVALARALAQEPLILLLDEPTTYLDSASQSEIMQTIHSIHHQRELTTLLVSHDTPMVEQFSDRIYLLENGKCREIR